MRIWDQVLIFVKIIVETFYCKCLLQRMGIFRFALFSQRNERGIDGISKNGIVIAEICRENFIFLNTITLHNG